MSMIAWLCVAMVVVPIAGLVWSLISVDRAGLAAVRLNLTRSKGVQTVRPADSEHFRFTEMGERLAPKGYTSWLDKLLARAGRPVGMPLARLLVIKPALALVAALLGLMFVLGSPSVGNFLLALFVTALAYMIPDVLVHSRGATRQKQIELELPNMLDQLLISVEAGLGFEAAMSRVGKNGKGPLAAEIVRTLQDMQAGRSRKESYIAMSQRVEVPDLRSFVRAIVQADTYGIAIASVLRVQAKQMRIKRRQRAEEKAMKLPVKVLFPLIFCILPALFIVIIGPAAINVVRNFMGNF
ncbi:type II secretion system F family protein [Arthrobacter sp. ISL-30]|uniref:type II secretion system F family protein n=1 Tax=Arthrobacter sp. ISL-30 TaxID=2819109 RepID=UPI001BE77B1C|nr:type II secretion system F family protein [Arthrobacter sp. ISL-30]MBT2514381.1 type II secretion system F family protein [Arthrobacter sp. ISL-30]